jgi:hypothetical protein
MSLTPAKGGAGRGEDLFVKKINNNFKLCVSASLR